MDQESSPRFVIPPISAAAHGALYQQIIDGVKREISEGHLKPGAPLPSFRALAEDLMVSIITVKRAYDELEREGLIYRRQGLGTFVSEDGAARSREAKLKQTEQLFRQALQEGAEAGLSGEDLLDMVRGFLNEREQ